MGRKSNQKLRKKAQRIGLIMPRKKNPKTMYVVKSATNNYTHGAFPYTEEGKSRAEAFVKKAYREKKEKLEIQEQ